MKNNLMNHFKKDKIKPNSQNRLIKFLTNSMSIPAPEEQRCKDRSDMGINCINMKQLESVFGEKEISIIINTKTIEKIVENVNWEISSKNDQKEEIAQQNGLENLSLNSIELTSLSFFLQKSSCSYELLDNIINLISEKNIQLIPISQKRSSNENFDKIHYFERPKATIIKNSTGIKNRNSNMNYSKFSSYSEHNEVFNIVENSVNMNSTTKRFTQPINNKTLGKNFSVHLNKKESYTTKNSLRDGKKILPLNSVKGDAKENLYKDEDYKYPNTTNNSFHPKDSQASVNIFMSTNIHSSRDELFNPVSKTLNLYQQKLSKFVERSQSPVSQNGRVESPRNLKYKNISNKLISTNNESSFKKDNKNDNKLINNGLYKLE